MKQSTGDKLKKRGLNTEFLAWLAGNEQRLPNLFQVRKIKDRDFVGALRAADWLVEQFSEPELISPDTPEEWMARYDFLEKFLLASIRWSVTYHLTTVAADLESLERVLSELLPHGSWEQYRKDIQHLRERGQPAAPENTKARASGGTPQSEETLRMRAAIRYVSTVSKRPYSDLAEFWNEQGGQKVYQPDEIQSRLRKGHEFSRRPGAQERGVAFWRRVYEGDLRDAYPGPFPLSHLLEEHFRRRAAVIEAGKHSEGKPASTGRTPKFRNPR